MGLPAWPACAVPSGARDDPDHAAHAHPGFGDLRHRGHLAWWSHRGMQRRRRAFRDEPASARATDGGGLGMKSPAAQILIVEDEAPIRALLRATLKAEGYGVHEAVNAQEGETLAGNRRIDLMLIDLGLPDADGVSLIRRLRQWTDRPIIVLSARSQESQKVEALDAGADDFLAKPFGVAELHARLRVALRHSAHSALAGGSALTMGPVRIDLAAKTVQRDGETLRLTATQWRLLEVLARQAGRLITSQPFLREVWGPAHAEQGHYLRVDVRQLRQRLEVEPSRPRFLLTEAGIGYRLLAEANEANEASSEDSGPR